jgi:hypothetical protein
MDVGLGSAPEGKITSPIPGELLKAVVSIETTAPTPTPTPIGTGFLMQTEKSHVIIVTAKHVITGDGPRPMENLAYRFNNTEHKSDLVRDDTSGALEQRSSNRLLHVSRYRPAVLSLCFTIALTFCFRVSVAQGINARTGDGINLLRRRAHA